MIKKQLIKKVVMVALSFLMLATYLSQPAMAAEPRARICGVCGEGIMITEKTYSPWSVDKEVKCSHYVYGYDIIWERSVYSKTICSICRQGYTNNTTIETKTVCEGSSTP